MQVKRLIEVLPYKAKKILLKIVKKTARECDSVLLRVLWESIYGIRVGMGSYGCFCPGMFCQGDSIGNYCSIAIEVSHLNANHPMHHAAMTPLFYQKSFCNNPKAKDVKRTVLRIGHDVWIGKGVSILAGVTSIGNGAVIGAGSVVTRNIEPYEIVAGTPTRFIRKRFEDSVIEELEASHWWELAPEQLIKLQDVVDDPKTFAIQARGLLKL